MAWQVPDDTLIVDRGGLADQADGRISGAEVMKQWTDDHPKATLMGRKRAAILRAAKQAFLEAGYTGTSMEGIAREADVSIMTLYRHARSKDELFAAVTASACEPVNSAELERLEQIMRLPLQQALFESAVHMQENLVREDTLALLRLAMAEVGRFPHLAELAYAGFIGRLVDVTDWILSQIAPASALDGPARQALAHAFVDRIVGIELLRALFGLTLPSAEEIRQRAQSACDAVMGALTRT